jgi:hypothetical protein
MLIFKGLTASIIETLSFVGLFAFPSVDRRPLSNEINRLCTRFLTKDSFDIFSQACSGLRVFNNIKPFTIIDIFPSKQLYQLATVF